MGTLDVAATVSSVEGELGAPAARVAMRSSTSARIVGTKRSRSKVGLVLRIQILWDSTDCGFLLISFAVRTEDEPVAMVRGSEVVTDSERWLQVVEDADYTQLMDLCDIMADVSKQRTPGYVCTAIARRAHLRCVHLDHARSFIREHMDKYNKANADRRERMARLAAERAEDRREQDRVNATAAERKVALTQTINTYRQDIYYNSGGYCTQIEVLRAIQDCHLDNWHLRTKNKNVPITLEEIKMCWVPFKQIVLGGFIDADSAAKVRMFRLRHCILTG